MTDLQTLVWLASNCGLLTVSASFFQAFPKCFLSFFSSRVKILPCQTIFLPNLSWIILAFSIFNLVYQTLVSFVGVSRFFLWVSTICFLVLLHWLFWVLFTILCKMFVLVNTSCIWRGSAHNLNSVLFLPRYFWGSSFRKGFIQVDYE